MQYAGSKAAALGHSGYAFNLHPDITSLGGAYLDLIDAYNWRNITILYQDNNSLRTLKQLLERTAASGPQNKLRQRS